MAKKKDQGRMGFSLLKENPIYASPVGYTNTGNLLMNWAIANDAGRGFPRGKSVELFGDPSTGKSLLAYQALAATQEAGGLACLDDVERALFPDFASMLGIKTKDLMVANSKTIEDCFENIEGAIKHGLSSKIKNMTIVIDSIAALSSRHEADVGFEKRDMTKAYLIRQGFRVLTPLLSEAGYLLIVLNHVTANIGDMFNPRTTPGGTGIKFNASVRLSLSYKGRVPKDKKLPARGVLTRFVVEKNRIAPPFRDGVVYIDWKKGVTPYAGIMDKLESMGILEQAESPAYIAFLDDDDGTKYAKKSFDNDFQKIAEERGFDSAEEFLNTLLSDEETAEDDTVEDE